MSRERAKRRAERERLAAIAEAERTAQAERAARRAARRQRLFGWIPRPAPGQSGVLARRRREQAGYFVAFLVVVNLLTFFATQDWALRAMVALLSSFLGPIVISFITRKGPS